MPFPNPQTQFKPGESGNPAGYSRRRRAIDHLMELIDEKQADKAIAQRWLQAILEGDFRYMKEYLDRRDGRPKDLEGHGQEDDNSPATDEHGNPLEP